MSSETTTLRIVIAAFTDFLTVNNWHNIFSKENLENLVALVVILNRKKLDLMKVAVCPIDYV